MAEPEPRRGELISILRTCLGHLGESGTSAWSTGSVAELTESIGQMLIQLEQGGPANPIWLTVLFAPTGDLQETAVDNGWGEAFLDLACRFEQALK